MNQLAAHVRAAIQSVIQKAQMLNLSYEGVVSAIPIGVVSLMVALAPVDGIVTFPVRAVLLCFGGAIAAFLLAKSDILLPPIVKYLLVPLFTISLVISCILSGSFTTSFFGSQNYWQGPITIISSGLIGLYIARYYRKSYQTILLVTALIVAFLSFAQIPFKLESLLEGIRLKGWLNNSVLTAIVVGVGCICLPYKHMKWPQYLSLMAMLSVLFLTQTRGVVYVVCIGLVTMLVWRLAHKRGRKGYMKTLLACSLSLLIVATVSLVGSMGRLGNIHKLSTAATYRVDLANHGISLTTLMPAWGFGSGNIVEVYKEYGSTLSTKIAASYKNDNVQIESTHTIALDMLLQYGWVAGLLFGLLVGLTCFYAIILLKTRSDLIAPLLFLYMFVQQMFTVSWLETDLIFAISAALVWHEYARYKKRVDANYKSAPPWIKKRYIYFSYILAAILSTVILIGLDLHSGVRRLADGFVFPIKSPNVMIEAGSEYENVAGRWSTTALSSQHELYPATDIFVAPGARVVAAKTGTVVAVRDNGCDGAGQFPNIYVRGTDQLVYYYAHLKSHSIKVEKGDYIFAGQELAEVGSADCAMSSPPHLHFDVSRFYALRSRSDTLLKNVNYVDPQSNLVKAYKLQKP